MHLWPDFRVIFICLWKANLSLLPPLWVAIFQFSQQPGSPFSLFVSATKSNTSFLLVHSFKNWLIEKEKSPTDDLTPHQIIPIFLNKIFFFWDFDWAQSIPSWKIRKRQFAICMFQLFWEIVTFCTNTLHCFCFFKPFNRISPKFSFHSATKKTMVGMIYVLK